MSEWQGLNERRAEMKGHLVGKTSSCAANTNNSPTKNVSSQTPLFGQHSDVTQTSPPNQTDKEPHKLLTAFQLKRDRR